MKSNDEKIFYTGIFIFIFIMAVISATCSIQSYKSRRLCTQLRGRIADAENTNKTLELTIEQCRSISEELGKSIDRNLNSAREAVELIEQIRTQVYELEDYLGSFNQSEYYSYWDSYFGID